MSNYLTDALDEALARFGTYTYGDKGAHEVMDVPVLVTTLQRRDAEQVLADMAVLAEHEHGAELYETLFMSLVEDGDHPDTDALHQRLPSEPGGVPLPQRRMQPARIRVIQVDDLGSALGL